MSYSPIESLERRCLNSLTFPDAVDPTSFDFSIIKSTGSFEGATDLHVVIADGRFTMTEDRVTSEGYYNYFRGDRRSAGGISLYFDDERPNPFFGLDFASLTRGVYRGTFSMEAWAEGNHTPSTARGTFSANVTPGNGAVQGKVFDDQDADGVIDLYESGVPGATVWADLNENKQYDRREPRTFTNSHGDYTLKGVPAGWQRTIRYVGPGAWEAVGQSAAGRTISVLAKTTTGPINLSAGNDAWLRGTVFHDADANGQISAADGAVAGAHVWADLDGDRRQDADEPVAWTDSRGRYILHATIPAGTPVRVQSDYTTVAGPRKRYYVFTTDAVRLSNVNFLVR